MIPEKIIKALEYCAGQGITSECEGCKYKKGCRADLIVDALALINRQKAEIERLQTENKLLIKNSPSTKYPNCVLVGDALVYTKTLEDYDKLLHDISAETIKEFAEKAEEVKRGFWEKKTDGKVWWYACSVCGEEIPKHSWGHDWFSNGCPSCRAKMDIVPEEADKQS